MHVTVAIVVITLSLLTAAAPFASDSGGIRIPLIASRWSATPAGLAEKHHPARASESTPFNATNRFLLQRDRILKRVASGAVELEAGSTQYFAEIYIGTPPQNVLVVADTGSADLWVIRKGSQASKTHEGNTYHPEMSSTRKTEGKTFELRYIGDSGNEITRGDINTDDVSIAGLKFPQVTVGATETVSSQFNNFVADGVLGLGLPLLSAMEHPFTRALAESGVVADPRVSLVLVSPLDEEQVKERSELVLGGLNPARFVQPITYIDVVSSVYWAIPLSSVSVSTHTHATFTHAVGPLIAHIDSGTTGIIGDIDTVRALHRHIPGSLEQAPAPDHTINFRLPCDNAAALRLSFGGTSSSSYVVPADRLVVSRWGDATCTSVITGSPKIKHLLVGQVFLMHAYTTFVLPTRDNPRARIGFAQLSPLTYYSDSEDAAESV